MFNKKNPMRYFSGSTFARLPLYKLAAGGTAVVLTASIGLGAIFMLLIDTLARTVSASEIPVPILTAVIGAPVFIILLRKTGGLRG